MAQVNPLTRELLVKLVYYGPGLGGKTTSLQRIHQASPAETRGQIVSLATPVDRTLYFDFLPLRAASVRGHHVRLQLFTVPGQVYFNATRKLVLTGADGVVFVADSQRERHDANLESLENLMANLETRGRGLGEIPLVLQYNKRDLPHVMDIEELDESLNPHGAPAFPTCAADGEGVLQASAAADKYSIGVDIDQCDVAPGHVMASMLKRGDIAVYSLIKDEVEGRTVKPGTYSFDLKSGGVELLMCPQTIDMVPEDVKSKVSELRDAVINGDIKITE